MNIKMNIKKIIPRLENFFMGLFFLTLLIWGLVKNFFGTAAILLFIYNLVKLTESIFDKRFEEKGIFHLFNIFVCLMLIQEITFKSLADSKQSNHYQSNSSYLDNQDEQNSGEIIELKDKQISLNVDQGLLILNANSKKSQTSQNISNQAK